MRRLIVDLARGGQTVLLSSHLLDEVQEICDRVGVINNGVLLRSRRSPTCVAVRRWPSAGSRSTGPWRSRWAWPATTACTWTATGCWSTSTPDRAPELVRELVAGGVQVHEVGSVERTLEEVFFEMTRIETSNELEATR